MGRNDIEHEFRMGVRSGFCDLGATVNLVHFGGRFHPKVVHIAIAERRNFIGDLVAELAESTAPSMWYLDGVAERFSETATGRNVVEFGGNAGRLLFRAIQQDGDERI
jgi:hypothetical protein